MCAWHVTPRKRARTRKTENLGKAFFGNSVFNTIPLKTPKKTQKAGLFCFSPALASLAHAYTWPSFKEGNRVNITRVKYHAGRNYKTEPLPVRHEPAQVSTTTTHYNHTHNDARNILLAAGAQIPPPSHAGRLGPRRPLRPGAWARPELHTTSIYIIINPYINPEIYNPYTNPEIYNPFRFARSAPSRSVS